MADDYDPFGLRKQPGYYAELVQDREGDVAAEFAKNHAYQGGILGQLETNPHGLGDSPLPFDPTGAEARSTSEGGSAFVERPKEHRYVQMLEEASPMAAPNMGYGLGTGIGEIGTNTADAVGSLKEGAFSDAAKSAGAALGSGALLAAGAFIPGMKGGKLPKPREIDARGFYSPSLEASKGLGQEAGTVQQFRSMLLKAGGKPKELEAVGFDKAFPDPNAKVSRSDIEQYLRDNRVQLGEKILGGPRQGELEAANEAFITHARDRMDLSQREANDLALDVANGRLSASERQYLSPETRTFASRLRAASVARGEDSPAKFESYSTPGGIPGSYREVVTTLPVKRSQREAELSRRTDLSPSEASELVEGVPDYISSHWPGITNPLLHYRQKDFLNHADPTSVGRPEIVTPAPPHGSGDLGSRSGKPGALPEPTKTRVLDEMQSDWAQRARDAGTRDPAQIAELQARADDAIVKQNALHEQAISELGIRPDPSSTPNQRAMEAQVSLMRMRDGIGGTPEQQARAKEILNQVIVLNDIYNDATNKVKAAQKGVPSAPYISSTSDWVDLGLKQALIDAAKDPSVSRLAWAPGKVQAERYNMGEHVEGLRYNPESGRLEKRMGDSWYPIHIPPATNGHVTPDALPSVIGKELSAEMLKQPATGGFHTLADLKNVHVGGEGHKGFYGDMTPEGYQSGIVGTRLQKLVKGLDPEAARVEPTDLTGIDIVQSGKRWRASSRDNSEGRWFDNHDEAVAYSKEQARKATYPSVKITPAMREKILKEGLPLFNIAALSALVSRMLGQGPTDPEQEN